jgi:hypothetical protein
MNTETSLRGTKPVIARNEVEEPISFTAIAIVVGTMNNGDPRNDGRYLNIH